MSRKSHTAPLLALVTLTMLTCPGCFWVTTQGPYLGFLSIPIPVSPYFQKEKEDNFWIKERYDRVPVLGPLTQGGPAIALDTPSDDEVMRVLERAHPVQGGLPFMHEVQRNKVRMVKDKIADYVDPPRVYPLIGPAQQHHAHYKCTIYYENVTRVGWPLPHTLTDEDAQEVVYIDHNHFHMIGNVDTGASANF